LIGRFSDGEAAIANHDVARIGASAQISEEAVGNVVDLLVDIEKCNVPIGPRPSGHASRSESNHADVLIRPSADELHDVAHRSGLVVVRQRLSVQYGVHALDAV